MDQSPGLNTYQFAFWVPVNLSKPVIGKHDLFVLVDIYAGQRIFDQSTVLFFAFPERFFRQLLLRDIPNDTLVSKNIAITGNPQSRREETVHPCSILFAKLYRIISNGPFSLYFLLKFVSIARTNV